MNTNALLVARDSTESNPIIAEAAARTGRTLRHITDSRQAFNLLRTGLYGVDLVMIDVDPGIHGLSILEAIGGCETVPPVIAITGLEESEMTPIAHRHGATACIAKPFTAPELVALIEEVHAAAGRPEAAWCDRWGHPHWRRPQITRKCTGACRACNAAGGSTSGRARSL